MYHAYICNVFKHTQMLRNLNVSLLFQSQALVFQMCREAKLILVSSESRTTACPSEPPSLCNICKLDSLSAAWCTMSFLYVLHSCLF